MLSKSARGPHALALSLQPAEEAEAPHGRGFRGDQPWAMGPRPRYGRLRGDVDLDLPRPGFLTQREPQGQHAVLVFGRSLAGIHRLWKRERTAERAVAPLDVVELLF